MMSSLAIAVRIHVFSVAVLIPYAACLSEETDSEVTSRLLREILDVRDLQNEGVKIQQGLRWSPGGNRLLVHGDGLNHAMLIDVDSKRFAHYISESDREASQLNLTTLGGKTISVPSTIRTVGGRKRGAAMGPQLMANSLLLWVENPPKSNPRLARVSYGFKDYSYFSAPSTSVSLQPADRSGNNAFFWQRGGSERKGTIVSLSDGTSTVVTQDSSSALPYVVVANSIAAAAVYNENPKAYSIVPKTSYNATIVFGKNESVIDASFCNQDRWLCCLLKIKGRDGFCLRFYDVTTGVETQEVFTEQRVISENWRSITSTISGETLFIANDLRILDWNGERFSMVADAGSPRLNKIIREHYVSGSPAMDPSGKKIAIRLRGRETQTDRLCVLSVDALRSAAKSQKKNTQLTSPPPQRPLSSRTPSKVPFELRKPHMPGDLTIHWQVDSYSFHNGGGQLGLVGQDRWIALQSNANTLVYDTWTDQQYDLNQLAWDHHRQGKIYREEINLVNSQSFHEAPDQNSLIVHHEDGLWVWDLSGQSPTLVNTLDYPRRSRSKDDVVDRLMDSSRLDIQVLTKTQAGAFPKMLLMNGGEMAVCEVSGNKLETVGAAKDGLEYAVLSENRDKLIAVCRSNSSSSQTELRTYRLLPELKGEDIRQVDGEVIALSNPGSEYALVRNGKKLYVDALSQDGTLRHELGFSGYADDLHYYPEAHSWILEDDDDDDSLLLRRLGQNFEHLGDMRFANSKRYRPEGIALSSDASYLALFDQSDDAVIVVPTDWTGSEPK